MTTGHVTFIFLSLYSAQNKFRTHRPYESAKLFKLEIINSLEFNLVLRN